MTAIKQREFERHLEAQGCSFVRHRGNHTIWGKAGVTAAITGNGRDVSPGVIRAVCKFLAIPYP